MASTVITGATDWSAATGAGYLPVGVSADSTAYSMRLGAITGKANVSAISTSPSATDTTLIVYGLPDGAIANGGYVVIDPFTVQCEIRKYTAISTLTLTVDALTYDHAVDDAVIFTSDPTANVKWFGALGNNATDDTAAIQAAIDAMENAAPSHIRGNIVYFPAGRYVITSPLILPRTTLTPTNVVWLIGESIRGVTINASGLSANEAAIEWDQTTATRAWHQHIENIDFTLPDVAGVMAIHYKTIETDKTDYASIATEKIQIDIKNVLIEGSCEYHTRAIYIEGNCTLSNFENIYIDPKVGGAQTNNVRAFEFDEDTGHVNNDATGCHFSTFQNIIAGYRRGGSGTLIKGRLFDCQLDNLLIGVKCVNGTVFELNNSSTCTIRNIGGEGGAWNPFIKISNSRNLQFYSTLVGSPVAHAGDSPGNGIDLINTQDCLFVGSHKASGNPTFQNLGLYHVSLDADSKRNRFLFWGVGSAGFTDIASEFDDSGTDNYFEVINTSADINEFVGQQSHGDMVHRATNAAESKRGYLTELITLSTGGATTDSSANLLPANSIIESVVARVTTTITTATDWAVGDSAQSARFITANATLIAGTTSVGLNHRDPTVASSNLGPVQSSAAKVRITTTGTPGAGVIRVTVFYRQYVAPTS